jgi:hypothetical protein
MPITAADLKGFLAANMPENDTGTSGGGISTAGKFEITDLAANDALEALSSNAADTMTLTLTGRNAAGAIVSETKALTGTTVVSFTVLATIKDFLKALLASAAAGTITVRRAGAGATVCTLEPAVTKAIRLFYDSTSESGITLRYEKVYYKNTHGTLTLTSAAIKLTSDPAARYRIGGAPSIDDTGSVANRKTAPGSVTFVDDNVSQSVPTGQIAAGSGIGIWVEQNLPANDPAHDNTLSIELAGSTTA